MANGFLGEATTVLDGKTYTLRWDMNAIAEFETETGADVMGFLADLDANKVSFANLRVLARAMLLRHHPEATLQLAGDILSVDPAVVTRVMALASPKAADAGNQTGRGRKATRG